MNAQYVLMCASLAHRIACSAWATVACLLTLFRICWFPDSTPKEMPLHPAERIVLRRSGSTRWTRVLQYHRMSIRSRRFPSQSSRTRFLFIVKVSSKNETVRVRQAARMAAGSSSTLCAVRYFHVVFEPVHKDHADGHPLLTYRTQKCRHS